MTNTLYFISRLAIICKDHEVLTQVLLDFYYKNGIDEREYDRRLVEKLDNESIITSLMGSNSLCEQHRERVETIVGSLISKFPDYNVAAMKKKHGDMWKPQTEEEKEEESRRTRELIEDLK